MNYSPYQVLFSGYPGKIVSNEGERVRVETIRGCEDADDLRPYRERLAGILSEHDTDYTSYVNEAHTRQEAAHRASAGEEDDEPEEDESVPDAFARREKRSRNSSQSVESSDVDSELEITYSFSDIELAELAEDSEVISVPYPRGYRCSSNSCSHYSVVSPEEVRDGKRCPDDSRSMKRFPYLFVCPRCAYHEQASPHRAMQQRYDDPQPNTVIDDNENRDRVACPRDDCSGHLHVDLGDRLGSVNFVCSACSQRYGFEGDCPKCHKPETEDSPAVTSELRPKPIDARHTQPLLLEDIDSPSGTSLAALREASREDKRDQDEFHWDLEKVASGSVETFRETFALNDVFSVSDLDTVSGVYGYESDVESRGTDLDERGRLVRTFRSDKDDYDRCAYITRQTGRGIIFDLRNDIIEDVIGGGEATYGEIASRELELLGDLEPSDITEGTTLELIPLLHAYQHALYQAAIEEAGLEDFLASKLLVEEGAIILVENRHVGAGGLSQITMNQTGGVLLRTLQRAEEILKDCSRECDDACLACVFGEDAKCHPFVSREVEGYVPPNSLLNRELAARVIRHA